jgi:enoyl-CoA hydratase/carnithine racemase
MRVQGLVPDGPVMSILAAADQRLDLPVSAYLSLTGAAVDSDCMMQLGLASHQIPDENSAEELVRYLAAFPPDAPPEDLDAALNHFCEWHTDPAMKEASKEVMASSGVVLPEEESDGPWTSEEQAAMKECFGEAQSVEETWNLLEARKGSGCLWSASALDGLREAPALSLLATARLVRESQSLTTPEVCALSAQVAARLAQSSPFESMVQHDQNGTSAALTTVENIQAVTRDEVESLFEP